MIPDTCPDCDSPRYKPIMSRGDDPHWTCGSTMGFFAERTEVCALRAKLRDANAFIADFVKECEWRADVQGTVGAWIKLYERAKDMLLKK